MTDNFMRGRYFLSMAASCRRHEGAARTLTTRPGLAGHARFERNNDEDRRSRRQTQAKRRTGGSARVTYHPRPQGATLWGPSTCTWSIVRTSTPGTAERTLLACKTFAVSERRSAVGRP